MSIHEEKPERPFGPIIAIDGEGYTLRSGRHRYVYMAACSAEDLVADIRNPRGLTTPEVLDFLLKLPGHPAMLCGFSLGYDRTMWLRNLPPPANYALFHPDECRQGPYGPRYIKWRDWRMNLIGTCFQVTTAEYTPEYDGKDKKTGKRRIRKRYHEQRTIWDLFRFYQSSFVSALRSWKVGTCGKKCGQTCTPQCEVARIEAMKAKRGSFSGIGKREERYCQSECKLLAILAANLIAAHKQEDLLLKDFYGPGSTAALALKKASAKDHTSGNVKP